MVEMDWYTNEYVRGLYGNLIFIQANYNNGLPAILLR